MVHLKVCVLEYCRRDGLREKQGGVCSCSLVASIASIKVEVIKKSGFNPSHYGPEKDKSDRRSASVQISGFLPLPTPLMVAESQAIVEIHLRLPGYSTTVPVAIMNKVTVLWAHKLGSSSLTACSHCSGNASRLRQLKHRIDIHYPYHPDVNSHDHSSTFSLTATLEVQVGQVK